LFAALFVHTQGCASLHDHLGFGFEQLIEAGVRCVAPFMGDDDVPAFEPDGYDDVVPELPPDLEWAYAQDAAAYEAGTWTPATEAPCLCRHCVPPGHGPDGLSEWASTTEEFAAHFRAAEASTGLAWKAAASLHGQVLADRGPNAAEHVGSHLALLMGVHPRTGATVCQTAIRAAQELPQLVQLVLAGKLTTRHVTAMLSEVGRWTDDDEQARLVLEQTLARCEERAERYGWPTPGEMKRQLAKVAILQDLQAAEKRRKCAAESRGVALWQTGPGGAALTIEGPDAQLVLAYRAIQERAEAMKHLEGDTRTRAQREADAAIELLTVDADMPPGGGVSARPTTGLHGEPLDLVVRGAHVAVVTPYSVTQGGDLELAEVPGFGYLLPSTTRDLVEHAERFTRVAVDATTGEVLAVDDAVPGPDRRRQPVDAGSHGVTTAVAQLRELAARQVIWRDLSTSAYRVPGRLRSFVEHRDRTCCFPGCTVPGRYCDVDHREEWPRGGTHKDNCHVLCRRHHRAKQFYFADVTIDPTTGDTCWTTPDGTVYRRPPPRW
jgi:hypothetical protein